MSSLLLICYCDIQRCNIHRYWHTWLSWPLDALLMKTEILSCSWIVERSSLHFICYCDIQRCNLHRYWRTWLSSPLAASLLLLIPKNPSLQLNCQMSSVLYICYCGIQYSIAISTGTGAPDSPHSQLHLLLCLDWRQVQLAGIPRTHFPLCLFAHFFLRFIFVINLRKILGHASSLLRCVTENGYMKGLMHC